MLLTAEQQRFLAELRARGPGPYWHIWGEHPMAQCGAIWPDDGMGYDKPWPDISSPFYEFYCQDCIAQRPASSDSLFGD